MNEYQTKASGSQDTWDTGSRRDNSEGKGAYHLLPPTVIRRDAGLYERGAKHYGDRNWEKGQPSSRLMQSLLRHAFQYLEGHRDEDHLAAIRWNAAGLMFNEDMVERGILPGELLDLPNYLGSDKKPSLDNTLPYDGVRL